VRRVSLLLVLLPALAVALPASAAPKVLCWKLVLNDAYAGVFGQVYPLSCYHQAIGHIPATDLIYSNMGDEIRNAEAAAANGKTYAIRRPQGAPVAATSSGGDSVPTPVLVLGVLAVVLLVVGGGGEIWRRTRGG
jgi:hypothetical protein